MSKSVACPSYLKNYDFTKGIQKEQFFENEEDFLIGIMEAESRIDQFVSKCNEDQDDSIDSKVLAAFRNKDLLEELLLFYHKGIQYVQLYEDKGLREMYAKKFASVFYAMGDIEKNLFEGLANVTDETREKILKMAPEATNDIRIANKLYHNPRVNINDNVDIALYLDNKDTLSTYSALLSKIQNAVIPSQKLKIIKGCIKSNKTVCNVLGYQDKIEKSKAEGMDFEFLEKVQKRIEKYLNQLLLVIKTNNNIVEVSVNEKQALQILRNCIKTIYGDAFTDILDKAFENNVVSYVDGQSKGYTLYEQPFNRVYCEKIKKINSLVTLSHEIGHYFDFTLSDKYLVGESAESDILTELPSTLNEIILLKYLDFLSQNLDMQSHTMNLAMQYNILIVYISNITQVLALYNLYINFEISAMKLSNPTYDDYKMVWKEEVIDKLTKDELDTFEINFNFDKNAYLIFDMANLTSLHFHSAEYMYGMIIAHKVASKLINENTDYSYSKKYYEYLKESGHLSFEEKLKALDIDLNDPTLISDIEGDLECSLARLIQISSILNIREGKIKEKIKKEAEERLNQSK